MDFMQLRTSLVPLSKSPSGDESVKTPGSGRTPSLRSNTETPAFTQKLQQSLRKGQPAEATAAKEENAKINEDAPSRDARTDISRDGKTAKDMRLSSKGSKSKASPLEWDQNPGPVAQPTRNPVSSPQMVSAPTVSASEPPSKPVSLQDSQRVQSPSYYPAGKQADLAPAISDTDQPLAAAIAAGHESDIWAAQQGTAQLGLARQAVLAGQPQERLFDVIGQNGLLSRDPALFAATMPGQIETYQPLQDISLVGNAAAMQPITPFIQQRPPTSANEFVDVLADRMGLDLDLSANNRPLINAPLSREMLDGSFFRSPAPNTNLAEVAQLAEQIANLGSQFEEFHFEPKSFLSTPQVATLVPGGVTAPGGAVLAAKAGDETTDPNKEFLMMIGSSSESSETPLLINRLPLARNTPVGPMDLRNMTQQFPQAVPNASFTELPAMPGYAPELAVASPYSSKAFQTDSLQQLLTQGLATSADSHGPLFRTASNFGTLAEANPATVAESMRSINMQLSAQPSGVTALPNSPLTTIAGAGAVHPNNLQTSAQVGNNNLSSLSEETNLNLQAGGLSMRRSAIDPMGEAWLQEDRDQRDPESQSDKFSNLDAGVFTKTDAPKAAATTLVQNNSAPAASLADSVSARAIDAANRMALQGQTGQARLTIRDSSIGSIDVIVSVNGRNSVAIDLQTNSSDIKKKLEGQVEDLKDRLHGQKFQSVDIKVVADNNAGAGFDASQGRGQNRDNQPSQSQSSERQTANHNNGGNGRNQEHNPGQNFAGSDSSNSRNRNSRDGSNSELRPVAERIQNGTARNAGTGRYSDVGPNSVNAKGNLNIRA